METVADELNALDGQLGDGDLGVTMTRGGRRCMDDPADAAGGCRHGADGLRAGDDEGVRIQLRHAAGDRTAGRGEGDQGAH